MIDTDALADWQDAMAELVGHIGQHLAASYRNSTSVTVQEDIARHGVNLAHGALDERPRNLGPF